MFDRGREAKELQTFILDLMEKDEVILIRGNHEDLFMQLLDLDEGFPCYPHDVNGTYNTGLQLIESDDTASIIYPKRYVASARRTPYVSRIIPSMLNYFETEHYIFVHGWIPCVNQGGGKYYGGWRNASAEMWDESRWLNGMQMWGAGVREEGKTIVCGHCRASYGHSKFEGKNGDPDDSPFVADGIMAIDACTKFSYKVNCVIIED